MTCPHCRHENTPGSKFCLECGTRLTTACPSCGHDLPGEAKFCNECGHRLPTPAGNSFVSPAAYTPKHLAQKILSSKNALEGERKQITVLFADLKGSMELSVAWMSQRVRWIITDPGPNRR